MILLFQKIVIIVLSKMELLFVCRANIGRSQMAKAFYNQYSQNGQAESAGTEVHEKEGERIINYPKASPVWEVMDQEWIDVRNYTRRQLTPEMVKEANIIVVILNKMQCPVYLLESTKAIYWDVEDPMKADYETHVRVKDQIKGLVQKLIAKER